MSTSTDKRFTYAWMPNRYADRVQRNAVLYPLAGRILKSPMEVRVWTNRLLSRWRARITALEHCGWQPRPTGLNTFIRNCCPTFVYASPRTKPCCLRAVCPFCYARWVRDIWEMVDHAFPNPREVTPAEEMANLSLESEADLKNDMPERARGARVTDGEGRPLRSIHLDDGVHVEDVSFPYHLIERYRTTFMPYLLEGGEVPPEVRVRRLMDQATEMRQRIMDVCRPRGAFAFCTIEPSSRGWRIRYRQLFQVPADYVLPEAILPGARILRHERPSRKVIFGAVARVCRYPTKMMTGEPELVAMELQARQPVRDTRRTVYGPRMSATYGKFRRDRNP